MRKLFVLVALFCIPLSVQGQTPPKAVLPKSEPIVASPAQQKEFKVLVEAQTKAQAGFDAAAAKLPEFTAFNAAKKALEDAIAKSPMKAKLDDAQDQVKDSAFKFMAELKLSSRKYSPSIDASGELVFTEIEKPEPKKPN